MTGAGRRTFLTLDGLRGLAALLVVYHHQHLAGINDAPGAAYLAVDLFFLMSGFVIAHAYEDRLRLGMGTLAFMRLRLIRLYPLYILGAGLGLSIALAFGRLCGAHAADAPDLLRAAALAIGLVPYLTADPSVVAFPLNGPAWSLFFELGVNLVYAVIGARLSVRALAAICAVSAALLGVLAWRAGSLNLGFQTIGFMGGAPRVSLGFFGGVLLYRLYRSGRLPRLGLSPLWAVAGTLALLCLPLAGDLGWAGALAIVLLGFPALLMLAVSGEEPQGRLAGAFAWSGEASYPLYAIHGPVIVGLMYASQFWGWRLSTLHPWLGLGMAPALAMAAVALSRTYDRPVRALLSAPKLGRVVSMTRG